ncbi:glycoside hydrolase [Paracidobacterium acidisoli]|nr:glycoside hydrolase [Paracidobacterium acidisoli]MBT9331505.1 RICIN domain-containing protein [Paracidobacterium acidisoli]
MMNFIRLPLVRHAAVCAMAALLPLGGHAGVPVARGTYLVGGAQTHAAVNPSRLVPKLEIGIDRSNMSTEWTLSPPAEPNIYPFNGSYNGTGIFEARRVAVFDGVAKFHPQWFRDGFGQDSPQGAQLFVDMVRQVHARGMKLLAVVGHSASDFDSKDYINPRESGCQWGTYPLSKINLSKLEQRVRVYFDAVKNAGLTVDAFEIGNELDLYCNDADMPRTSEFAAHGWKWFLTPAQVHAFAAGYAPFLKTYAQLIRKYFPTARIITCGMSNPTGNSAALIQALANFTDSSGKTFDYTSLVDGYGTHTYPPSDTTQHMVQNATSDLAAQGALLPHNRDKPIWITEWSESASVFWSSHKWSYQYDAHGKPGGDLNLAAGPYQAMSRAQAIETFRKDVIERLRTQPKPVNIGYLLYYSYDSEGKTDMCDGTGFNRSRNIKGTCFNGLIDPVTGDPLPDIALALTGQPPAKEEPKAAAAVPEMLINTGRIMPRSAQTFRGWGMSLAWEANDLYGGGRQTAQIKDPKIQSQYMDLLFGDPATRLTLGFNIARYNIGGGDDPSHTHMRPDAQMEGYQSSPGAAFDWSRDASQRRMLQEAKKRGANIFEAASYSPPYWMTVSGCYSGSKDGKQDNLRPEMRESFVNYLATVVKHFQDAEGIRFESVEPFNEPDGGWEAGGRQEGYTVPVATQNAVLPVLADRLKRDGVKTFVAGVDTNNIYSAVSIGGQLSGDALSGTARLNTHDYHPLVGDVAKLRELRALAEKLHKPIWMSELGCCFTNQGDKSDMWGALFMADSIRMDLRDMGAEAWVLWQPDWGVIAFDPKSGEPHLQKQYYALAQYTRFIRPGFQIISAGGAFHTLAAYSRSAKRLVLVTTNWDTPAGNDLDLTAFTGLPSSVTAYRTTADEPVSLREEKIAVSATGRIVDSLPVRSITTYVVDGVTPAANAPASAIEGTHEVVSQATRLCMNITTNSTSPGGAIIPYSCGAYNNEEFNFVDEGGGFYSIQTVNGAAGLCLNVSNGVGSPGDGKTRGGPGNLIQWDCGNGSLPANDLFEMTPAGEGSYQIRVRSSGLCLEDPGRGGTFRQDRCSPTLPNQQFTLTE